MPNDTLGLRVPAHPLILDVLHLMAGPLALTSANRSGQSDAVDANEVVDYLGDDVQLVLDDGRSQFGQPSSVVRVDNNRLKVLRQGVVWWHILMAGHQATGPVVGRPKICLQSVTGFR